MIEETIEMETPEVVDEFDEEIVPVEDEGSILPVVALATAGVGAIAGVVIAAKKANVIGRMKAFFKAGADAFKNFEAPEEESTEVEASDVEVKNVEDPAE